MIMPGDGPERWDRAVRAALLLAVDPGLGGAVVRAGPSPAHDAWLSLFRALQPDAAPWRRLPPGIDDDRLLGGLDLAAALAGRRVLQPGLLAGAEGGVLVAPMAERMGPATAARLAAALDAGGQFTLIALDEGGPDDPPCPDAAADRLAFRIDLEGLALRDLEPISAGWAEIGAARQGLAAISTDDAAIGALCGAAETLGVHSLRAPLLALRAARAQAALGGRETVDAPDLALAAALVLGPRATRRPAPSEAEPAADTPPPQEAGDAAEGEDQAPGQLDDLVLEAATAALPPGLEALWAQSGRRRAGPAPPGGGGARVISPRRGRRIGARPGSPRDGVLDVVETLKAAAPWQGLRAGDAAPGLRLRRDDFRLRRFERRAESTVILVVDASGSSALQRLAETKGAVELLLERAYARRTQVALIAFRGEAAELLLPPTRSLTRARRRLAELAGGGATPLASALEAATLLAQAEKARGRTPVVVLMTDGRGNIALDGAAFRTRAETDAQSAATRLAATGTKAALIDISARPRGEGEALAQAMGARFAVLPHVQAGAVRDLVRTLDPAL